MTAAETAWLAGLFEGEGTINGKHGKAVEIRIGMTDEDVVRHAHTIAGVGTVLGPYKQRNEKWKPQWHWTVQRSAEAAALLRQLYPYLGERRRARTDEVIEAWEARPYIGAGAKQRAKTHCPKGHYFDEANTQWTTTKEGWRTRHCRTCGRERYHRVKEDATRPRCELEDCDRSAHIRGMCRKHYIRWQKHGDAHLVARRTGELVWAS